MLAACDADVWEDELPPPRDELLRRIAGRDGVLSLLTDRVDDAFLDAAGPQLKVVSQLRGRLRQHRRRGLRRGAASPSATRRAS